MSLLSTLLFYNTLTYFITYLNFHRTQQRLSFSLLIILYCLFIVPECSTTLFVHILMSSAPDCYCWMPAACLFACLLVATGISGYPLIFKVRPVMSHCLYHHVCGECCHSILCWLTADAWSPSLICFLCRRSPYSELQPAFTGTLTACYQLRLSLISTILQPLTHNNQFTSLMEHP